jgi:predicted ATPase
MSMLTHLHVQNYKCLRDVQIDLAPFTILIGPNDSGKSSLLDVVKVLGKLASGDLQQLFADTLPNLIWRKDLNSKLLIAVDWKAAETSYSWRTAISPQLLASADEKLMRNGQPLFSFVQVKGQVGQCLLTFSNPAPVQIAVLGGRTAFALAIQHDNSRMFAGLAASLASSEKYSFDPEVLRLPSQLQRNALLRPHGENLVAVLDLIVGAPDPTLRAELERVIQTEIPTLRGISLTATDNGQKSLDFTLAGNGKPFVTIPASLASEGALLLTAFLAIAYGNTPDILLIEEPENGLHPSRLKQVVELLRKISTGAIGNRPRQVIISTHSPILLNYARPEEVRVLSRDIERGTQVVPLTSVRDIDKLLKEFAIGELWYMLGEEALLKETPA